MIRFADEKFRSMLPVPRHESFFENEEFVKRQILNILTSPANLRRLIFFDARGSETALKDKSSNAKNATLSLAASSLDTDRKGRAKILNFNAAGDFWDFADSDDLSFGDGSNDSAFSIVKCLNVNSAPNQYFISKYNLTTGSVGREYVSILNSGKLNFRIHDNSTAGYIGRSYNTAITGDYGSFNTYIDTYDGSKNVSGIKIYRNGSRVDDTNLTSGTYVAMENTASNLGSYYTDSSGVKQQTCNSKMAFFAIVSEELTQEQITAIDTLLRRHLGVI